MRRSHVLPEIRALDPATDHERIGRLSSGVDFPWDTRQALGLAMLRTFCDPEASRLMHATGEFTERAQKRYDDTVAIMGTLGLEGYSSEVGRAALRRMNQIHRRFAPGASNEAYLYTLTLFALEPIRWNERFGWRPLHEHERQASFFFWREVGRRMSIEGIPDSLAAMDSWSRAYEARTFAYDPANRALLDACIEMFLSWGPLPPSSRLGAQAVHALFDPPMLRAFGLEPPPTWVRRAVVGALELRARALRWVPARRTPVGLPPLRSHPGGVDMARVGPDRAAPDDRS